MLKQLSDKISVKKKKRGGGGKSAHIIKSETGKTSLQTHKGSSLLVHQSKTMTFYSLMKLDQEKKKIWRQKGKH